MLPTFANARDPRSKDFFQQYCEQLGHIVGKRRTEIALKAARVSAELAAEAAKDALLEAQSASRAKSEFLANMSHELRTPLNAIIGFSQVMAAEMLGPVGSAKYLEYSHDIGSSAGHLLGLINDILDLARIEAGKLDLYEETVELSRLIDACIVIVRQRAEKAQLTLRINGPVTPLSIWADERKLKQIVINLLSNAVKFTPPGGAVAIDWQGEPDGGCRLVVSDTGIGIAPDDLSRVLEPFAQADSDLNRRYEGTGLGLPLTRRLVELHGGALKLESAIGNGTTVTVMLPVERLRPNGMPNPPADGSADRETEVPPQVAATVAGDDR
jgi:signal transduction histidine kinase